MSSSSESFRLQMGARLQAARKHLGLSQDDLANKSGIARGTLSRYERGELTPPADVLVALIGALQNEQPLSSEISSEWLLFGDPDELEKPDPILLRDFGLLVRLRFQEAGIADVSMGRTEVRQVLEGCIAHELRQEKPNQSVITALKGLRKYYLEVEGLEMIAEVLIGIHAVKLQRVLRPEVTEQQARDKAALQQEFFPRLRESTSINQTISGENHQISGRDIVNKGEKSKAKAGMKKKPSK